MRFIIRYRFYILRNLCLSFTFRNILDKPFVDEYVSQERRCLQTITGNKFGCKLKHILRVEMKDTVVTVHSIKAYDGMDAQLTTKNRLRYLKETGRCAFGILS